MRRRVYNAAIEAQFEEDRQMLFLMGPRQVGKTTASLLSGHDDEDLYYFNWDDLEQRALLTKGASAIAEEVDLEALREPKPVIIFDEVHKAPHWKALLKGFFDLYGTLAHILVTGSARLDVYKKGGDSLMGRYFRYRLHPFSVAELVNPTLPKGEIRSPKSLPKADWERLLTFGGFPEPYLNGTRRFYNRWRTMRNHQVFREDLRDLSRVQELSQIELLAELMRLQAGSLTSYHSWATHVRISSDTVRRWVELLQSVFYCFAIRPWSKNVGRSLLKEPKFYLYDWSLVDDEGARFENLVASHLLKAVHFWSDYGFGEYGLFYIRTKEKREVDFCVTKEGKPWILVEAKVGKERLSPQLGYFQEKLGCPYAFQVVRDLPYVNKDCFAQDRPLIVPARTFLSQLI
ncbi:MAG: ATP-binding protein [Parachlamydiales bacterium]